MSADTVDSRAAQNILGGARIKSLADIRKYILAGDAVFTLVSLRSKQRKTFRVKSNGDGAWFVSLFTNKYGQGPDNDQSYTYLAFMYPSKAVRGDLLLKKNKDGFGKEAHETFQWLTLRLWHAYDISDPEAAKKHDESFTSAAEFWHSGRCSRCGRTLTDPESIKSGLGPVCAEAVNG